MEKIISFFISVLLFVLFSTTASAGVFKTQDGGLLIPDPIIGSYELADIDFSTSSESLETGSSQVRGVTSNSDGTKIMLVEEGGVIKEYNLSNAWDITSDSFVEEVNFSNIFPNDSIDVTYGLDSNEDGTRVFGAGFTDGVFYQIDLGSSLDLSTITDTSVVSIPGTVEALGVTLNSTGDTIYWSESSNYRQAALSTSYEITSIGSASGIKAKTDDPEERGFNVVNNDLDLLAGVRDGEKVIEYEFSSAGDISTITNVDTGSLTMATGSTTMQGANWFENGNSVIAFGIDLDGTHEILKFE